MTQDQDGYWELLDFYLRSSCQLSVRFKPWHLVWAGIIGRLVFHGQIKIAIHAHLQK